MLKQGHRAYFNTYSFSSIRLSCPHLNSKAIVAAILFCKRSFPTLNRNNNLLFSFKSNPRSPNTDQLEHGLTLLTPKVLHGQVHDMDFYRETGNFFNYILFAFKAYLTQFTTLATRPAVIFISLFSLNIESLSSATASFKCWLKSYLSLLTAYQSNGISVSQS